MLSNGAGSVRRIVTAVLAVLLCTSVVTACTSDKNDSKTPEWQAAKAYLDAFGKADSATAAAKTTDPTNAVVTLKASVEGLAAGSTGLVGTLTVKSLSDRTANAAMIAYSAAWKLPGISTVWAYNGTMAMAKANGKWAVKWAPTDVHPALTAGRHLMLKLTQGTRGALQDSAGTPLFADTPVVTIGIDGSKVGDLNSVASSLAAVLASYGVTATEIVADVTAAPSGQFVPVIVLRKTVYATVKPLIYDLPGVLFPESTQLLGPTSNFGQPLLGRVGTATKELIDASSGRLHTGDVTGLSGLQRAYDAQLSGTEGADVYAAADADNTAGPKIATVSAPTAGSSVKLTLNSAAQTAADTALASIALPAALVAIQPSTGKILAVANSSSANDDIAMVGQYPAGSTFKIATYTGIFTANPNLTQDSPVACPAATVVNGQTFVNEDKFQHGTIPISAAFAYSCNTTAINLEGILQEGTLGAAAKALGLGATWSLPVDAFSGSLPAPASANERAADAIGQGKVLVSPLLMALMAGAAASGKSIAPSLLDAQPGAVGATFDPALTAKMVALMRATVAQSGATATLLNDLPGDIGGKTGTAEFGTDDPPKTHAWFAGERGDLAFAVFVYGGDSAKVPALPIAHAFLAAYSQ
jgi:cell division protein FtsI/penicillin-binding protein 2